MKSKNYLITYISALAIGILLLIYHQQESLYQTIVIAIGALIALPSLVLLLTMLFRKKPEVSTAGTSAVTIASEVAAAAGLAFGIWMMCSPQFFITAIIYTLGAILILVGVAQITYIYEAAKPFRPAAGWYIVPLLTLIAGIVIILLGPAKVSSCAGLITGIVLVVYAANGFASAGREAKFVEEESRLIQAREEEKEREKEQKEEKDKHPDEEGSKAGETAGPGE